MTSFRSDWVELSASLANQTNPSFSWVFDPARDDARPYRVLVCSAFGHMDTQSRRLVLQSIRTGDAPQRESTLYELLIFELLYRLGLRPSFQPRVQKKTPDLLFSLAGQDFIGDVYVTHSKADNLREVPLAEQLLNLPHRLGKIIRRIGGRSYASWDCGERGQKMAHEISKKVTRYKKLGMPLVVFVILGDRLGLSLRNVSQALFGRLHDWHEFDLSDATDPKLQPVLPHDPLFLPNDDGTPAYTTLAAVVGCDFFSSQNPAVPGYRLAAHVMHHWRANYPLESGAFGSFPELRWKADGQRTWKWEFVPNSPIVARFTLSKGIQFGLHTDDTLW